MSTAAAPTRRLVFERLGGAFALPCEAVTAVVRNRQPLEVPLAPPAIAGLTLEGGRLLTVIEIDSMVSGEDAGARDRYLVVLAPPFAHLALRVSARPRLETVVSDIPVFDVERLVQVVETAIVRRGY